MKEIIAKEGMWLTQAVLEDETKRSFWKKVSLAISASKRDFVEWNALQKERWENLYKTIEN